MRVNIPSTPRDFLFSHLLMKKLYFLLAVAFASFSACTSQNKNSEPQTQTEMITTDPHSFSKPNEAVVKHLALDIAVDFEKKILSGSAKLDIEVKDNATEIILDTRDLNIEKVVLADGTEAKFELG